LDILLDSLDGGSARRKASTYTGQHNKEKRWHTSMPRAGRESAILVFERLKTVRALDRAAIGAGSSLIIYV
jgi:hypothetical protein